MGVVSTAANAVATAAGNAATAATGKLADLKTAADNAETAVAN